MTLTFTLRNRCPECGCVVRGFQMAFGVRVNLHSVKTTRSLTVHAACDECGFPTRNLSGWDMHLDPGDVVKVEEKRAKIRARRVSRPEPV